MKRFFLISTNHLMDRLWFRDEDDFRMAMNYMAIAAFLSGVLVLAFILMSNHVHFVVCGNRERAELFINKFKQLYATYYQRKYGVREFLRRNGVDFREVRNEDESLERAIAYVLMNPVVEKQCQITSELLPFAQRFRPSGILCAGKRRRGPVPDSEKTRIFSENIFKGPAPAGRRSHTLFPRPEYPLCL